MRVILVAGRVEARRRFDIRVLRMFGGRRCGSCTAVLISNFSEHLAATMGVWWNLDFSQNLLTAWLLTALFVTNPAL